jgi:hypothetical protein
VLQEIATKSERLRAALHSPKSDMDMGVLGVEVRDGDPLQGGLKLLFHSAHEVAGKAREIQPVAELRRDDDLPQPKVALGLPGLESFRDFDSTRVSVESGSASWAGGALSLDVSAVCPPLSSDGVSRIRDPDRAALTSPGPGT